MKLSELWQALQKPEHRSTKRIFAVIVAGVVCVGLSIGFIKAPRQAPLILIAIIVSLGLVFLFEVWDVLRDQFTNFLKNWGNKETEELRRTTWFFSIVIIAGLVAALFYQTCCDSCDSVLAPAGMNSSPASANATLSATNAHGPNSTSAPTAAVGISPTNVAESTNLSPGNAMAHQNSATRQDGRTRRVQHKVTIFLWSFACLACGSLTGFLFGIPKVLQSGGRRRDPTNDKKAEAEADEYRQQVNTNLTEISDWITKIIVGLGLINLKVIPGRIRDAAEILAQGLQGCGSKSEHVAFAVAVILFFSTIGFLFGYLMTRLFLAAAFSRADTGRTTRLDIESTGAEVESLKTDLSFLKSAAPPAGAYAAGMQIAPAEAQPLSVEERVLAMAKRGVDAHRIKDDAQRIKGKDQAANEIARMVLNKEITKDWLVEAAPKQAVTHSQDPLIAGLAVAINILPEPGDLDRLARVASMAEWPNTRTKICAAIGKLFSDARASKEHVPIAQKILIAFAVRDTDEFVQRRVRETAALITRMTGVSVNLAAP